MSENLAELRRGYAEEIGRLAGVTWRPIVEAFAAVPREAFAGPGPWKIYDAGLQPRLIPDGDPSPLYANVLISLDEAKNLNNGQPQFWAWLFERLIPTVGERVIHVGAGGGYYTAILAEMVGPTGSVTGIEFEPELAARAAASLVDRPNVEVLAGDAHALARGAADIIVASCGFDAVPAAWARLLAEGGRLLVPLTAGSAYPGIGGGALLLVTRRGDAYDARFVGSTMIYHDMSGRSKAATRRLAQALPPLEPDKPWRAPEIASLRIGTPPDETCWLAGEGWWISTAPNP